MSINDLFNKDLSPADDCLDWDAAIENDGEEYIILDEGDYIYTITGFDRDRFPGSEKIPPCNKAVLTALVNTGKGKARIRFDLILYRTLEWRLSAFFRSLGQKKQGEKLNMDWTTVLGSRGMAHIRPRTYVNKYGEEKTVNDIAYFIDYDDELFADADDAEFAELIGDAVVPF